MSLYECIFIARQDLTASQVNELLSHYTQVIKDNGGNIVSSESWGLKKMAYEIKKNARGHYVLMNIEAPFAAIKEVERQMYINEDVLRYFTLKLEAFAPGPSVMMQAKYEKAARDSILDAQVTPATEVAEVLEEISGEQAHD